jgi:hypothetical protein
MSNEHDDDETERPAPASHMWGSRGWHARHELEERAVRLPALRRRLPRATGRTVQRLFGGEDRGKS